MKKSIIAYTFALLVCLGLTSSARATLVDANDEWGMVLQPGESFTCLAHFIPDVPGIPESLIFEQSPKWTDTYSFDHETAGWDTALADGGKTAYLFGPRITNNESSPTYLFSYNLYYQWNDEDPDYNPDYLVYLDWVIFDGPATIRDYAWRRTAGGTWERYDNTWSGPYENPEVPEPMTICLLGLGVAFLRKRR